MSHFRENLLVQFSVMSFVVMAVIAVILAVALGSRIQTETIAALVDEAVDHASGRLLWAITPADLEVPMTGERYDSFHEFVQRSIVSHHTARIKLWAVDGTVIYSNDPSGVGERFPDKDNLQRALSGENATELKIPTDPDNEREQYLGTLIEVYTPIVFPGETEPQGVLEIYQYYQPTADRISAFQNWLVGSIAVGFFALYVGLVSIVWRGWNTISKQRRDIELVNVELDKKVDELLTSTVSRDYLDSILNSVSEGITVEDSTDRFTFVNPAAAKILGYAPDELVGQYFSLVIPPDQMPIIRAANERRSRGESDRYELQLQRKDGSLIDVLMSGTPRFNGTEYAGTLGVFTDITERVQAEQALRQSEQRLRQVTGAIDQYIYSLDIEADGARYCSLTTPSVTRFTGRSPEEHLADPDLWIQHIHPEDRQREEDDFQALVDDPAATLAAYEYRVVDTDGNVLWAREDLHVTRDQSGRAVCIDGIVTDVTALREARQALQERNRALESANEQLKELDQIKSSFLANMSHELRTPLNSIIGFSQLLADGMVGELADQQREFAEDIHGSGQDLLTLINDLLDLSKIEAGQLELHPESISFEELAQETIDTVLPLAQQKGQKLTADIPSDLPSLNADRFRIKQVLLNLLSNANKFTPEGGSITLGAHVLDETALLCSVRDTGMGIPAESLDLIFEEFRQADNPPAHGMQGTGLGLPISRRLIEMHGGTIWVESTMGEGSTFSFLLPLSGPQDARPTVYAEPGMGETWPQDSERLVMIVEDDRRFSNMLAFYFTREGFDVAQIYSGDQVVERARQLGPCLISLDLMLPQTDGWQVLRQLKADPQTADIPVVIVSVLDPNESGGSWQSLGALDYIVKPLSREQVERLLARARASLPRPIRVLVVDDDPETGGLLQLTFPPPAFSTELVTDAQEALERLASDLPDVLVLDLMMPGLSGIELLERLRQDPATQDLPVVILSAKKLTSEEEAHLGSMAQAIIHKGERMQLSKLLEQVKQTLDLEQEPVHA